MALTSEQRAAEAAAKKRQRQVAEAVAAALLFLRPRLTILLAWMPATWSEFSDHLGRALDPVASAGDEAGKAVFAGFDGLDHQTVNQQRAQRDKLVSDLTKTTESAVKQVVTWATSAGISAEAADAIIGELAGLNSNQLSPILTNLSSMASTGATTSDLIKAAARGAKGGIDKRAAVIAADALWAGVQQGQVLAGAQLARQTNARVTKSWATEGDEKVCQICGPLDGVTVGIDEFYPGGFKAPGEPHSGCRCHQVIGTEE